MGFSTTLGMYNLRQFLFKLSERLTSEGISQMPGILVKADVSNLKGFGPQTKVLSIHKNEVDLLGIDACDDEGYSAWGKNELEGYAEATSAIDKQDMERSVEAIKLLISRV